jgi:hypothetical protein
LTTRDLSDFYFDAQDRGGKKNYLTNVSGRIGLTGASMAEAPMFLRGHLALSHDPLYLNVGVAEYPHPFKFEDGVGGNRRGETSSDVLSGQKIERNILTDLFFNC